MERNDNGRTDRRSGYNLRTRKSKFSKFIEKKSKKESDEESSSSAEDSRSFSERPKRKRSSGGQKTALSPTNRSYSKPAVVSSESSEKEFSSIEFPSSFEERESSGQNKSSSEEERESSERESSERESSDKERGSSERESSSEKESEGSDGEYYKIDIDPLCSVIFRELIKEFPDADDKKIRKALHKAIYEVGDDMVNEYCEAVPKDARWKSKLSNEEIEVLEPTLKKIRQKIADEEPTIAKILSSGLPFDEMKRLIMLFDQYQNMEPYTTDHFHIREILASKIKTSEGIKTLRNKITEEEPTLEKIEASNLLSEDKKF